MEFQNYLVNNFTLKLLHSHDDIKQIYRIRHHQRGHEFHFIEPEAYARRHDIDEYDQFATHLLIEHNHSHLLGSCIRIVPGEKQGKSKHLPIEQHYYNELDALARQNLHRSRSKLCEISRLAVNTQFKWYENGALITQNRDFKLPKNEYTKLQTLAISTFLAATMVALDYGFNRAYAMIEPFLVRRLALLSIPMLKVGKEVDFQGLRAPYMIDLSDISQHTHNTLRCLYQAVQQAIMVSHQPYYCVLDPHLCKQTGSH